MRAQFVSAAALVMLAACSAPATHEEIGNSEQVGSSESALSSAGWREDFNTIDATQWQATYASKADWPQNRGNCVPQNVVNQSGQLVLKYTGATHDCSQLRGLQSSRFGRYKARMKRACGSGLDTGFFLYTDANGWYGGPGHREVDIELLGAQPNSVHLNTWVNNNQSPLDPAYTNDCNSFHDYQILLIDNGNTTATVKWYVDNVLKGTSVSTSAWVPKDANMYVHLNVWNPANAPNQGQANPNAYWPAVGAATTSDAYAYVDCVSYKPWTGANATTECF
jgi:beta-glucanase (GH16 family)